MKKTLFAAALAFVLTIGGLTASAESDVSSLENRGVYYTQTLKLATSAATIDKVALTMDYAKNLDVDGKSFGYRLGDEFVSLGEASKNPEALLNQSIEFGYRNSDGKFEPKTVSLKVSADPGYYADYKEESFLQLDFAKDPFDGVIDILVMGEPLPASTVTLLVALGAGALFLLYRNRRRRISGAEQV